jgi:hypothetical protein
LYIIYKYIGDPSLDYPYFNSLLLLLLLFMFD